MKALAVPMRREIFESLVKAPRSVGEIATQFPTTQSAVSQHLKVLAGAGLVHVTKEGTRRIYRVNPDGLKEFRRYVDSMWDEALLSFASYASREK
jgi:DNA-binding transcriptional ArsR family regulator